MRIIIASFLIITTLCISVFFGAAIYALVSQQYESSDTMGWDCMGVKGQEYPV
jgi:hypothetical protein